MLERRQAIEEALVPGTVPLIFLYYIGRSERPLVLDFAANLLTEWTSSWLPWSAFQKLNAVVLKLFPSLSGPTIAYCWIRWAKIPFGLKTLFILISLWYYSETGIQWFADGKTWSSYGVVMFAMYYYLLITHICIERMRNETPISKTMPPYHQPWHFEDRVLEPVYLVSSPAFAHGAFKSYLNFFQSLKRQAEPLRKYVYEVLDLEHLNVAFVTKLLLGLLACSISFAGFCLNLSSWREYGSGIGLMMGFLTWKDFNPLKRLPTIFVHYAIEVRGRYYELERVRGSGFLQGEVKLVERPLNRMDQKDGRSMEEKRPYFSRTKCAFTVLTHEEIMVAGGQTIDIIPRYDPLVYNCQALVQNLLARIYTDKNCKSLNEVARLWGRLNNDPEKDFRGAEKMLHERMDARWHHSNKLAMCENVIMDGVYERAYRSPWSSLDRLNEGWRNQNANAGLWILIILIQCFRVRNPTNVAIRAIVVAMGAFLELIAWFVAVRSLTFFVATQHGRKYQHETGLPQIYGAALVLRLLLNVLGLEEQHRKLSSMPSLYAAGTVAILIVTASMFHLYRNFRTKQIHVRTWPDDVFYRLVKTRDGRLERRMLSRYPGRGSDRNDEDPTGGMFPVFADAKILRGLAYLDSTYRDEANGPMGLAKWEPLKHFSHEECESVAASEPVSPLANVRWIVSGGLFLKYADEIDMKKQL